MSNMESGRMIGGMDMAALDPATLAYGRDPACLARHTDFLGQEFVDSVQWTAEGDLAQPLTADAKRLRLLESSYRMASLLATRRDEVVED